MKSTGITDFRAQMKEWMDNAEEGPVRVNRPSGKSVIIVDAQDYEKMALELAELRGVVKGLKALGEAKTSPFSSDEMKKISADAKARFKSRNAKKAAV